jgi:hypothetical protein
MYTRNDIKSLTEEVSVIIYHARIKSSGHPFRVDAIGSFLWGKKVLNIVV